MAVPVVMPHLGETVAEGTVLEWLKREGDPVRKDEPLLAISTEKVDAEVPAPADGVLSRILVQAGEAVPVGSPLAEIEPVGSRGASAAGGERREATAEPAAEAAARPLERSALSPQPSATLEPQRAASPSAIRDVQSATRFYSPAVVRLAEQFGVDLDALQGTGEGGRVSKRDVERHLERRARGPTGAADAEEPGEERVPLTRMRRAIAERLLRSVQSAPHATAVREADFTAIARFRARRQEAFLKASGVKLTFLPFVVKATVEALRAFPRLNARWGDDAILLQRRIHLGIAVALGDELAVPVLRSPEALSVSEIARRIAELVSRARDGRAQPEEVAGSTFTVNNFGADGSLLGTPLLNPPEVGILGLGAIEKRPVVRSREGEDVIAIRSTGYLCLSFDHRVVDGAMAGRFLGAIARTLESFRPGQGLWADEALREG
jgi:2-oxoglutarate dehydrogenase E2 component (dihydrolipoamide succinyltransferase)